MANPLNRGVGLGEDLIPVTPSDASDLAIPGRAIRCRPDGVGGILRFTSNSGTVRNTYIEAGGVIWTPVLKVHDTGTDATLLEIYV